MNPARSLGPAVASGDRHQLWIYLTAPPLGMLIAVAAAYILRGPGGGPDGTRAAQGTLPDTPMAPPQVIPTDRRAADIRGCAGGSVSAPEQRHISGNGI
ncbi:MAG: aquaporin [Mycobacterium sp.]|jgi:hypothetical protein|nr:aquaporin [Mycobacterium sp.]